MDAEQYLAVVRDESHRIIESATGRLDDRVPACPDWAVDELVGHVAWVYRFVDHVLGLDEGERPDRRSIPVSPRGPEVIEDFREATDRVIDALERVDPAKTVVTFTGPQPASWWLRRLAHETAMHRWDVQSSSDTVEPIAPEVAVDGIDEALEVMTTTRFDQGSFGPSGETMHLHATDTDGEWMIIFGADAVTWHRGHEKGDVAARGTASDLLLFFYSRLPAARLEVFGDREILQRYQQASTY